MRKSVKQFIQACEAGNTSAAAILGMRRTLKWSATDEEFQAVVAAVEKHKPAVPAAQCEEGRAWLLNRSLKKNGEPRKNPLIRAPESLAIIRGAYCARLIGWDEVYRGRRSDGRGISDWFPIYRYEMAGGAHFDYSPRSWQSGRKTEIYGWGNGA
jgi:hypothetical protein